jgi:DNA-binding PadR family transcriptional regulator
MSPRPIGFITGRVLLAIQQRHRHGADIMIATGQGGGTIYKVLRRLELRGHIEGHWEDPQLAEAECSPRRRYYSLTPTGEVQLAAALARYRDLGGRIVRD